MKFYIASRLENSEMVRRVSDALQALGHEHTYDWTKVGSVTGSYAAIGMAAEAEFNGVKDADVVFALLPGGRGTHVEIGMALGLHKKVYLWAPQENTDLLGTGKDTCAFYHLCASASGGDPVRVVCSWLPFAEVGLGKVAP